MDSFLTLTKALADETRLRALMALKQGELCLCQIIDLLGLAPSTVSKHMTVLYHAGLVRRRKQGRWHYYKLAGGEAAPMVRAALKWVSQGLAGEKTIVRDAGELCCIRAKDPKELTACYTGA